jgi:hypothetical protein
MSGIGGVGSNNNYIPGAGSTVGVGGTSNVPGSNESGKVSTLGGQLFAPLSLAGNTTGVTYAQPSPLDPSHLVLPVGINDSTNVDITACLVLLLQTANQMRKDQRQEWIKEAQNALSSSNTAADLQKKAAQEKLIGDCVSNSVQIVASVAQAGASIGEVGSELSASKEIEASATREFGPAETSNTNSNNRTNSVSGSAEEDLEAESTARNIINQEGLTNSSLGGEELAPTDEVSASERRTLENVQHTESEQVQTEGGTSDEGVQDRASRNAAEESKAQTKRQERATYVGNMEHARTAKIAARVQIANGFLGALGTAGKMAGAIGDYASAETTAEATKEKALADFQTTAAQTQLDFSNDLQAYAQAILSTIRDVESARHAASNAIANI